MSAAEKWVTTSDALVGAIKEGVGKVVISGRLSNAPSLHLSARTVLVRRRRGFEHRVRGRR